MAAGGCRWLPVAAGGAAAHRALSVRQALLPPTMVAQIVYHVALGVGQTDCQAHIQANRSMFARRSLRMHVADSILWAVSQTISTYQCPSAARPDGL